MLFAILLVILPLVRATYVISVYGDVYNDRDFFTSTYPWIIDNIGGDITVDYHLLGTGKYTVAQMCVLAELRSNTYLQAQYLKCEAEGMASDYCFCETGLDPYVFKQCVRESGYLAAQASANFQKLGIDASPLIELGPQNTVFGVTASWYLKKICTIFGDFKPRGCTKPFACNGTESFEHIKAIAQADKCCSQVVCEQTQSSTTTHYGTNTASTQVYIPPDAQ